jgi:hypothetical protein
MSFNLQTLTEGIRERHVGTHNKRLLEKWSRTGLLRGMDDVNRENMACLLENQAAQLLREANTLGGGASGGPHNVNGFTNIAFPIVRRVFGGLVANELVSIQPMSLPSGLLFYLDYTYGGNQGAASGDADGKDVGGALYQEGKSIYNNPTGKGIQSGSLGAGGQYDLVGSGFSKNYKIATEAANGANILASSGRFKSDGTFEDDKDLDPTVSHNQKALQFDSQILERADTVVNGGLAEKY